MSRLIRIQLALLRPDKKRASSMKMNRSALGHAVVLATAAAIAWPAFAIASAWTHIADESAIDLPPPTQARGIFSAALRCTEQRWSLDLTLEPGREAPAEMPNAVLAIGEQTFNSIGKAATGGISLPLARLAIGPLKGGIRLQVDFPGAEPALGAAFSLRGSKAAIEAAEPLCTKRDMTGYDQIVLSPYSSYVLEATELRKEEIKVFKQATSSLPKLAAGLTALGGDRQLLFVETCGSSWYYGASGCNLAGFAKASADAQWTLVYDAEGADLYQDNGTATDGWPNLIALPKKGGGDEIVWAWTGSEYAAALPDLVGSVPPAQSAGTGQ
jgi:hypothetical protein